MNNRSLAIEISKHPLIKKLLEGKLATSSEVARLVVEELLLKESDIALINRWESLLKSQDKKIIDHVKSNPDFLQILINDYKTLDTEDQHALGEENILRIKNLMTQLTGGKAQTTPALRKDILADLSQQIGKKIPQIKTKDVWIGAYVELLSTVKEKYPEFLKEKDYDPTQSINSIAGIIKSYADSPETFDVGKASKSLSSFIVEFDKESKGILVKKLIELITPEKPEETLSKAVADAKEQIEDADFFKDNLPAKAHVPFYELFILLKGQSLQEENREFFNADDFIAKKGYAFDKYNEALKKLGDEKSKIISAVFKNEKKVRQFAELFGVDSEESTKDEQPTKLTQVATVIATKVEDEKPNIEDKDDKIIDTVVTDEIENTPELVNQSPEIKDQIKDEVKKLLKGEETTEIDPTEFSKTQKLITDFIDTFYDQGYLYQQGVLVMGLLGGLRDFVKEDDREKAAGRSPSKKIQELQEAEEEEVQASKRDIRNLQVDFRSLLQNIKRAKGALETFSKAATDGKLVSGHHKGQFIKIAETIQKSIAKLVQAVQKILQEPIQEAKESKESEDKWLEIEKGYEKVKSLLRDVMTADSAKEVQNLKNRVTDAIEVLQSISHYFPNVNPFKNKDVDFSDMTTQFDDAIKRAKPYLQNLLDLSKTGTGGEDSLEQAIEAMKEFSGEIQRIFGVKSLFKDLQVDPKEKAVEGDPDEEGEGEEVDEETKALTAQAIKEYQKFYSGTIIPYITNYEKKGEAPTELELQEDKEDVMNLLKTLKSSKDLFVIFSQKEKTKSAYSQAKMFRDAYEKLKGVTKSGYAVSGLDQQKKVKETIEQIRKFLKTNENLFELASSTIKATRSGEPFSKEDVVKIIEQLKKAAGGEIFLKGDMISRLKRASIKGAKAYDAVRNQTIGNLKDLRSDFFKIASNLSAKVEKQFLNVSARVAKQEKEQKTFSEAKATEKEESRYIKGYEELMHRMISFVAFYDTLKAAVLAFNKNIEEEGDDRGKAYEQMSKQITKTEKALMKAKKTVLKLSTLAREGVITSDDAERYGFPPPMKEPEEVEVEEDEDFPEDTSEKELAVINKFLKFLEEGYQLEAKKLNEATIKDLQKHYVGKKEKAIAFAIEGAINKLSNENQQIFIKIIEDESKYNALIKTIEKRILSKTKTLDKESEDLPTVEIEEIEDEILKNVPEEKALSFSQGLNDVNYGGVDPFKVAFDLGEINLDDHWTDKLNSLTKDQQQKIVKDIQNEIEAKSLFNEKELKVIEKFIELLGPPEVKESLGTVGNSALQRLGYSKEQIKKAVGGLNANEQKTLSSIFKGKYGPDLSKKIDTFKKMLKAKKSSKPEQEEEEEEETEEEPRPNRFFDDEEDIETEDETDYLSSKTTQEQIANKLKPLIWETIRKNK
jgi:hypothetical protein